MMLDLILAKAKEFPVDSFEHCRQYEALALSNAFQKQRIWVHTYGIGKFGLQKQTTLHFCLKSAEASKAVLGGSIKEYKEA